MIPILYEANETTFTSNGLGRLSDCISCVVTEERNGKYELQLEYPVTGIHFEDITEGRIIAVTHDANGDVQPFDIYASEKPIDGIVTFYARHISYRANEITVPFYTNLWYPTAQTVVDGCIAASVPTNPFTFTTDITATTPGFGFSTPMQFRTILGGTAGSVLDTFGGEFEWDKFNIKLHQSRGANNGVKIAYRKNLLDFKSGTDYADAYTGVIPYWKGQDANTNTEKIVKTSSAVNSGHSLPSGRTVIVPLDLSDQFETEPSVASLTSAATAYMTAHSVWNPSETLDVDFVQLWNSEEYEEYAPLEKCVLCDTVNVSFGMYGLADEAIKIVAVEWDALADRYTKMTLGGIATSLADAINANISGSVQAVGATATEALNRVTDVTVNGTSVVTDGVAAVTVPTSAKTAFTPTSGSSYSTYGGCFYEVYGNVIVVNISVSGLTANTNTAIYTLPSGARPKSRVFGKAGSGSGQGLSSIDINTTGVISVVSAGTYCIGSVTYIL